MRKKGDWEEGTPAVNTFFVSMIYLIRQELSIQPPIKIRSAIFCMTVFTRECTTQRQGEKTFLNFSVKRLGNDDEKTVINIMLVTRKRKGKAQ